MKVSIKGISKAKVLLALFNNSKPQGVGILTFAVFSAEKILTEEMCEEILKKTTDFDYLIGKPLKVNFLSDESFDARLYDSNNGGEGTAQRVIDSIK